MYASTNLKKQKFYCWVKINVLVKLYLTIVFQIRHTDTKKPAFQKETRAKNWWRWRELNPRPKDFHKRRLHA